MEKRIFLTFLVLLLSGNGANSECKLIVNTEYLVKCMYTWKYTICMQCSFCMTEYIECITADMNFKCNFDAKNCVFGDRYAPHHFN